MIKKILIANRGEIALRIIRTCKELNIKTVAVYSSADKNALHVRFADEAVCIGPQDAANSYLNIPRIIAAAVITNSDAIHPGYGFLAENPEFAEICFDSNIIFIGPSPEIIRKMNNKFEAKMFAKSLGIPVIQGSEKTLSNFEEVRTFCEEISYPVILKASAGERGKGMRTVRDSDKLEDAFNITRYEASNAFGSNDIYIEKLIESPRHIEIQILGDSEGNIISLGERDCTIQRRHQKVISETPSPVIDNELRTKISDAAVLIGKSLNYVGAGTVEFLVDKDKNFYFLEMNTRLQAGHPITEAVVNMDLVKEQIYLADGNKLSRKKIKFFGHSIECRINAENPDKYFSPSLGLITAFHSPGGTGVRVDTHCYAGYNVPQGYDTMIAKLIVHAANREEAIRRMSRALDEFIVEGIHTTIPLFQNIMKDPEFINNDFDTNYLEKKIGN